LPLGYTVIFIAYYLFTLLLLRVTFFASRPPIRILLLLLVGAQLVLKLLDRYYFPFYLNSVRALDENVWLSFLANYQSTGKILFDQLAQGPGIYYLSSAFGYIFHVDYGSALVGLAISFGSLYVIPAFLLYRVFFEGDGRLAFVNTLLLSLSDSMIYSTTVARPTLFGLFLLPLAVGAFQALRGKFRWRALGPLVLVSIMILLIHTPITFVVLLTVVSCSVLIFDKARKWEWGYVIFLFASYGLMLGLFLPDLERIWRMELFGGYPLNLISSMAGDAFFLTFPVVGVVILLLSCVSGRVGARLAKPRGLSEFKLPGKYAVVAGIILFVTVTAVLVLLKYQSYVASTYGSWSYFFLIHGWKIPFGVLAAVGLWSIGTRYKRSSNDTAFAWLLSILILVAILATYAPILVHSGLWDMDERFAEFTYYPAIYFVTVGLNHVKKRVSPQLFGWVILPILALFSIPSLIIGMRIHTFVLSFLER
jgi:hypothetical protein